MITRMAWQKFAKPASRTTAATILALSLGLAVQSRPAEANSNWVGPAIAGAVIGGVLANQYYRHRPYYYRPYYRRPVNYRWRYRGPAYYPRYYAPYPPAVVVPIPVPVPLFVVPGW
ncbi:MAG: hypothetical protein LJE67_15825 [Salaquimonas sp.]|nr:hypothetical protein [Salaquimonas sp.]